MALPEWLAYWMLAAILIAPLVWVERWIHRHIQGLGLLITNDPQAAVLIYYIALFPGVFLHEASQWVLAKLLRVQVKKFQLWPEKQKGGVIRLGLVEIDSKNTDTVRATLVGMVPMITGIAAIALIGSTRFDIRILADAFSSGDLPTMMQGIGQFFSAPDFWLWAYLVFSIANAMLPEEHDEINWWLLGGVFAGMLAFLLILDLGILVEAFLEGPFTWLGEFLSLALGIAMFIDLSVIALLALTEWIFKEFFDREVEYR